jgi:acetyl-CoA carboxylase biotin carboxyl carrier protein
MLPKATENLDSSLIEHEEDIISYCLFPEQALEYFKWRNTPPEERSPAPVDIELAASVKDSSPSPDMTLKNKSPQPVGESLMAPADYSGFSEIMQKMAELNISELHIRKGEKAVTLRAGAGAQSLTSPTVAPTGDADTESHPSPKEDILHDSNTAAAAECETLTIDSPLTGTFYSTPSPGKPPYVKPGVTVKKDDKVCIVEAMKLINEINAPFDCAIVDILVKDGENVEKGTALISITRL